MTLAIEYEKNTGDLVCHVLHCSQLNLFHWHDRYELCYCIDDCDFFIDGVLYNAKSGDIIAINEQTVHCFVVSKKGTRVALVQFYLSHLSSHGAVLPMLPPHVKGEDIKKIPRLCESVELFFSLLADNSPCESLADSPLVHSLIGSLYFLLAKSFGVKALTANKQKGDEEFYKIIEYINANFAEDISTQSIADALFLSRANLTAIFAKYSNVSLTEYLRNVRIKNANRLINRGLSITEAAFASGFQNTRTFNNVYKRVMGITPTEYEKSTKIDI